ncbi:MAG: FKBP-type peptidyl-prolyl cis-trans isomerase [Candidatus Acidoferrum typicum]|nr:FKBP-type peptidyl-prolyl cis-trans isomerase [Candidatus Acidoferrum typicum]
MTALFMLTAGMMHGNARAQQTPAAAPTPAPAAKTPQSPAAKTPPAKSGTAPAGKAPAAKSQSPTTLNTPEDKLSYAIGLNIGRSLQKDAIAVDPDIVAQGVKDALSGGNTLLTDEEAKAAIVALQADLRKKQEETMKAAGDVNKKQGDAFLTANKAKEGVVTLPSGLQYKIVTPGKGPKPAATDTVVCNYRGTLIDGTEFDSSYKRGQPATFPVGQVIPGWTEALQLMPVGSKWQLFIPPDLAYGERSPSPVIGVNSTLIFDIELLSIQGK